MTSQIRSSDSIANLAASLAAAQAEYKPAVKNCVNPHFKNRYADLSAIIEATRDALSKHGLSFIQCPMVAESRINTVSRLMHKSGEWVEFDLSLKPGQDTPQAFGSAITYGRRYSLGALLGISSDDDDDGNAAQPDTGAKKQLDEVMNAHAKRIQDMEAALRESNSYAKRGRELERNLEMLVRFEQKYGVSHQQLSTVCEGRTVANWTDEDIKKLTTVGLALKGGADWATIEELGA